MSTLVKEQQEIDVIVKDILADFDGRKNIDAVDIFNNEEMFRRAAIKAKLYPGTRPISVADWIFAAVNGDVQSHGLALLEKPFQNSLSRLFQRQIFQDL